MVEQRTENPRVVGSIPTGSTTCGLSSSGRAPPCQGEGRGFESRLALLSKEGRKDLLFLCFLPLASNFFCDIITDAKNVLHFVLY